MFSTLKMLASLSPAERETIASGQFAGDFTVEALLDQMRTLAKFDASNDATRATLKKWLGVSSLAAFALFWFSFMFGITLVVIALLCLAAAIYFGVTLGRLKKLDISNNFREVALPFLTILKQDMQAHQTLSVRVDLRAPTHEKKRRGTPASSKGGAYSKIVDTTYQDNWFAGTARLADASVLRWNVIDDLVESKRTKRSSSGKMKTKTRNYKRSTIAVSLSVSNKRYGVSGNASAEGQKIAVQGGAKRRTIKLTRKIKTKSLDPIGPEVLIDSVASAYRNVVAPTRSAA
jgi:hypothetical protein